MNAGQIRAIAAELPRDENTPVEINPWNQYGTVHVSIGDDLSRKQMIVRKDGAVFPWTGDIVEAVTLALDRLTAGVGRHP